MINFLKETMEAIKDCGRNVSDVMFVGSENGKYRMAWEKFEQKADFLYDNGYGAQEIAYDLIVCFKDGSYLDRYEYDGSESWAYHGPKNFKEDDEYEDFNILGGQDYMWETVEDMNEK